jgi:hypothetical protein
MLKNLKTIAFAAMALVMGNAAMAQSYLDGSTGNGFVSKGDCQLALGINNRDYQKDAENFDFKVQIEIDTEYYWKCTNGTDERTTERTTKTQGLVKRVVRDKNKQITGIFLTGFEGTPQVTTPGGSPINQCNGNGNALVDGSSGSRPGDTNGKIILKFNGSDYDINAEVVL